MQRRRSLWCLPIVINSFEQSHVRRFLDAYGFGMPKLVQASGDDSLSLSRASTRLRWRMRFSAISSESDGQEPSSPLFASTRQVVEIRACGTPR